MKIHLWEYAPSPHLGNVLKGMADRGYATRYVVHSESYAHRLAEGWVRPEFSGVEIIQATNIEEIRAIIADSIHNDVHICVGLRANDYNREVCSELRAANRRFLLFMETIDERSRFSVLKRPLYRMLFMRNRRWLEGVLAAGARTPQWVASRGVARTRIFDFAYFLGTREAYPQQQREDESYRFVFVGNLIHRKQVHLIIAAMGKLSENVKLDVIGDGALRADLEKQAAAQAPGRITFRGVRPMSDIAGFMAAADCLVLPSHHDGWGSVIPEAMLAGTPVVCSDSCGASAVVRASGRGVVFEASAPGACAAALGAQIAQGRPSATERAALADWALCLTEPAGAAYLDSIISYLRHDAPRPVPRGPRQTECRCRDRKP